LIRKVVVEGAEEEITYQAELFLYLADRAEHVRKVIQPAIKSNSLVLCDRFTDSTLAYQGYGREADIALVRRMNRLASGGVEPDLTFFLDCPVDLGLARAAKRIAGKTPGSSRPDRFENEDLDFHERVRKGFLELAQEEPGRIVVLDAAAPIREVHEEIKRIVDQKLRGSGQ
jgi:dTMP kinase